MFEDIFDRLTEGDRDEQSREGGTERAAEWPDATTGATPSGAEEVLGLDDVFGILSSRRRRGVLRFLATEASEVDHGTLAEHIAARENDKARSDITAQERKRVYISLYQSHLPKMAGKTAIDYDRDSGRITPGPNFELFLDHLPPQELTVGVSKPIEA